jgi:alkanesulfonate monooxygenase SsuD/methylene tetrahydromethanopterin reductase-like flavin-dependent oxidoreductase (luciferase family)
MNVVIGETEKDVKERLGWLRQHYLKAGVPQERVDRQIETEIAGIGVGTPEQIVEKLSALKASGLGYLIAYFTEAAYDTSGMHLFENRVIPEMR